MSAIDNWHAAKRRLREFDALVAQEGKGGDAYPGAFVITAKVWMRALVHSSGQTDQSLDDGFNHVAIQVFHRHLKEAVAEHRANLLSAIHRLHIEARNEARAVIAEGRAT